ncbi:DUF2933 domain-containing protein [uncultured Paracoccus sp.]|uniref:DUF2933 domain-containing protein n=1 Tax=uncultured Paracoccus sp. TaxID=189685 RepID=UPI002607B0FE|nr:DUF2933 domain-containing protein [uncultured Paracoccus sp.]
MNHNDDSTSRDFLASRSALVLAVFLAIGGFYLITEHTAHLVGYAPLLLLVALCGGMHFFMHGGHGHGGNGDNAERDHAPRGPAGADAPDRDDPG